MSYRINYGPERRRFGRIRGAWRLPALIAVCFALFISLVHTCWPDGAALLQKVISNPQGVVAVSALNELADVLQEGEGLTWAFKNFWEKLIA